MSPWLGNGKKTRRTMIPRTKTPASNRRSDGRQGSTRSGDDSDAAGGPVAFGRPIDAAQLGHRPTVRSDSRGHGLGPVEQPIELALIQVDTHDLSLDLVG